MMRFILRRRFTLRGYRWFWSLRAKNGETIAQGHTRGYSRKVDAEYAIELVQGSGIAVTDVVR